MTTDHSPAHALEHEGFFITQPLWEEETCRIFETHLDGLTITGAGSRSLLDMPWCLELAEALRTHASIAPVLPDQAIPIQCTFFEKSTDKNWQVSLHQDLSIPVAHKLDHPALKIWSEKEGKMFVQPPAEVLQQLLAVRWHIDECSAMDGALKVIPGSHRYGRLDLAEARAMREARGERLCPVPRGAAMLMRPLLLHASSKATGTSRRRVLHFLFAPKFLPFGLKC